MKKLLILFFCLNIYCSEEKSKDGRYSIKVDSEDNEQLLTFDNLEKVKKDVDTTNLPDDLNKLILGYYTLPACILYEHKNNIQAISTNSNLIASACEDNNIYTYNMLNKLITNFGYGDGIDIEIKAIDISPDHKYMAVSKSVQKNISKYEENIDIWQLSDQKIVETLSGNFKYPIYVLKFFENYLIARSIDGKTVVFKDFKSIKKPDDLEIKIIKDKNAVLIQDIKTKKEIIATDYPKNNQCFIDDGKVTLIDGNKIKADKSDFSQETKNLVIADKNKVKLIANYCK